MLQRVYKVTELCRIMTFTDVDSVRGPLTEFRLPLEVNWRLVAFQSVTENNILHLFTDDKHPCQETNIFAEVYAGHKISQGHGRVTQDARHSYHRTKGHMGARSDPLVTQKCGASRATEKLAALISRVFWDLITTLSYYVVFACVQWRREGGAGGGGLVPRGPGQLWGPGPVVGAWAKLDFFL